MVKKLKINESTQTDITIENFISMLDDIFHKYFPNADIDIEYVKNMRHDNIWITALGYGKFNIDASMDSDVDDVINFQVTIDLNKKYVDTSDFISATQKLTITPSGVIYLPRHTGYSYDRITGSGRNTTGEIDSILKKFDRFCYNCKLIYKKYYE